MTGYSTVQLVQFLESQKLVKKVGGVYYLTDKLSAITKVTSSPKEALRRFCDAIELPFQVTTPTGQKYTVKYLNDRIGKLYLQVLTQVDEEKLIEVTKKYYRETEYPVTIKNYFEQGVWESAMEDTSTPSSSNKFEDY